MPLLITETDGALVYKSLSVKESDAKDALALAAASSRRSGILTVGKRRVLIREILLCGKKRLFYMDFDRLCERYGDAGESAANGLLDAAFLNRLPCSQISLATLARVFAETYAPALRELGVNLSLHRLVQTQNVNAPVTALMFCLSLMVRIFAVSGATVSLSSVSTPNGVTVFADGSGEMARDAELLYAMLTEAAAVQGFAVDIIERDGMSSISLTLSPVDISLYGFKSADAAYIKKICETCLELVI